MKHELAFQPLKDADTELPVGGSYAWRVRGEYHLVNPETVAKVQRRFGRFEKTAARTGFQGHPVLRDKNKFISRQRRVPLRLVGEQIVDPKGFARSIGRKDTNVRLAF